MDGTKPLIFIKPYSKTLQKLFEVMQEASESQGTEIYEIDDLSEAVQIIPQIGQALIIAAHPRKTAQLLQTSRLAIKKNQSKVLLLTPKAIPRRAIDKFMKIGLTECIVEPIAPKTLQYKVNLILRSIMIRKEETDYDSKFGNGVEDDGSKDLQRRTFEAKEVSITDTDEQKLDEKEESATDQGPKKSTYKEEAIGGFYKGRVAKKEESSDEETEKKQSPLMQSIDGHYKNKLTQNEAATDEKPIKDKVDPTEDDDVEELAKRVNLLLDQDEAEEEALPNHDQSDKEALKKQKKLNIDSENEFEKAKRKLEEDEVEDEIARHHLELIDDASDETEEDLPEVEEESSVKKKKKIAIEDSEKESNPVSEDEQTEEAKSKKKKAKLKIEKEAKEASQREKVETKDREHKPTKLGLEEDDEDSSIDDLAQELEQKLRKKKTSLKIEKEVKEASEREEIDKKEREHKRTKAELDIEEDERKEKEPVAEREEREIERKKAKKLEVETDPGDDVQKRKDKEKREREKAQSQLEIEDDTKNRESQGYTEKEFNSKSSGYPENIQEKSGNKADAHSDDIDGYYDSRRSLEHGEDEWQEMERERQKKQERSEMRKNEYIVDPEPDLGEQTIDYSDLKKQFSGIGYSLGKKKKIGIFEDNAPAKKPLGFTSSVGIIEERLTEMEREEIQESEASKEGEICEAKLKSGPALIKALSLYLYHTKNREAVIQGILEILRDDLGVLIALKYGKGPNDGQLKIETIGNWLDQESKDGVINIHKSSADCPIVPAYSDKTFKQKRTTFYYPYTEGITTFAWAQGFFPAGTSEENLRGVEAVLETIRGALLDEFHELGGTGPYAKIEKKKGEKSDSSTASKVKNFFGGLFGKKKAS